jgi:protein-S-isoprenylcysteine O-methyltransferase Ste14
MAVWKHLRAIFLLPGTVTIVIPAAILYVTGIPVRLFPSPWNFVLPATGLVLVLLGLVLMVATIRLFVTIGKGTLAPWNPTQRLVVRGIYRHVRNPMIVGVFCVLLGESSSFGSPWLLGWFAIFCLTNTIYIPLWEEPGLVKRFGDDYRLYKKNVPRWVPRIKPWEGLPADRRTPEN